MLENLTIALQITLIGMGVVFAALLVLWLIMAALVRLTAEPVRAETADAPSTSQPDLHARIAAAAVAAARTQPRSIPPKESATPVTVNAWQSVMRGRQLNQRGRIR